MSFKVQGWERGAGRGARGNFLGDGNILYLRWGIRYTGVHICQNLPNGTFMCSSLYIYFTSVKHNFKINKMQVSSGRHHTLMYNDDDDQGGHPASACIPPVTGSSLPMEPGHHLFGSGTRI